MFESQLVLGGSIVVVVGIVSWFVGFVRAARRAPVNERMKRYCQR